MELKAKSVSLETAAWSPAPTVTVYSFPPPATGVVRVSILQAQAATIGPRTSTRPVL